MNKTNLENKLKKIPRGKFNQINYFEQLISTTNEPELVIDLAIEVQNYGIASEMAMKTGFIKKAINCATDYLDDRYYKNERHTLPERVINYLERKGAKEFSEWNGEKDELYRWATKLYQKEIDKVESNLNSLKEKKYGLEKKIQER